MLNIFARKEAEQNKFHDEKLTIAVKLLQKNHSTLLKHNLFQTSL